MKVLTIFGTRPEAIKLAPVIKCLEEEPDRFESIVCVTGQHREMLDQALTIFGIVPDYDLKIMNANQSLHGIISKALEGIKNVLERENPSIVVVQGDTTTTFAGSLAAYYAKVPIAHIEAGLRTHDKYRPFPEEINRRLTSQIADVHFAPTEWAKDNLLKENIDQKKIFITGNTVIDALFMMTKRQEDLREQSRLQSILGKNGVYLNRERRVILVTGHRRENFGEGFENICSALKEIASLYKDIDIVFPVHLNPNVQGPVNKILGGIGNVYLIKPLDYEPFIYLMSNSYLILTDSGGVQEEAPSLGKPVLVMRNSTERPEGVKAGTIRLVGTNKEKIIGETIKLLNDDKFYLKMSRAHNPYGDGMASKRIVQKLWEYLVEK